MSGISTRGISNEVMGSKYVGIERRYRNIHSDVVFGAKREVKKFYEYSSHSFQFSDVFRKHLGKVSTISLQEEFFSLVHRLSLHLLCYNSL